MTDARKQPQKVFTAEDLGLASNQRLVTFRTSPLHERLYTVIETTEKHVNSNSYSYTLASFKDEAKCQLDAQTKLVETERAILSAQIDTENVILILQGEQPIQRSGRRILQSNPVRVFRLNGSPVLESKQTDTESLTHVHLCGRPDIFVSQHFGMGTAYLKLWDLRNPHKVEIKAGDKKFRTSNADTLQVHGLSEGRLLINNQVVKVEDVPTHVIADLPDPPQSFLCETENGRLMDCRTSFQIVPDAKTAAPAQLLMSSTAIHYAFLLRNGNVVTLAEAGPVQIRDSTLKILHSEPFPRGERHHYSSTVLKNLGDCADLMATNAGLVLGENLVEYFAMCKVLIANFRRTVVETHFPATHLLPRTLLGIVAEYCLDANLYESVVREGLRKNAQLKGPGC